MSRTKIYFVSDLHLGLNAVHTSRERELRFVKWLDEISKDATALFILGDLFDFWFEYKHVVPKGFVRTLGTLASLKDAGLDVQFFTGNHDQWMRDYFETELGIPVHRKPRSLDIDGKKFIVGHGDGLGPGDAGYKAMKRVFTNPAANWAFARLHPNFAIWLGNKWSRNNRLLNGKHEEQLQDESNEWLIGFCRDVLKKEHVDFFIFGHRHLALDYNLSERSRYINLGDWLSFYSYAVFDGNNVALKYLDNDDIVPKSTNSDK